MARLRKTDGSSGWLLRSRDLIGRSRACTIRLDEPEVSGEHAVLRWTGACWDIKDLHSRNGVWVDGRRLEPGVPAMLAAGSVLGFGRADGYTLVDAGEPVAFAEPQDGGEPIESLGGILALPDPDAPAAMIFRTGATWSMDQAGEVVPIADGETVQVGATAFRVLLPEALPPTANAAPSAPQLDDLQLRFAVSRDEEYVELIALCGDRVFDLQARSHHYPLLLLARARLRQRDLPPAYQGWVHQHALLEQLRIDRNQLHLNIFRVRRQFGEAGIGEAARIIERRPNTSQLRIGVQHLEIVASDDDGSASGPQERDDPRRRAARSPR
ncbi:FHA domain-containing protein [Nannocystis sp. SCPEA4]|uniref:FHA domain-containing protein n=1 Tax=Nannocystis sp. SCPEA4 TaxID=2996787 RepID=UPI00226E2F51|nr:FHA domain-containing protein [Nannocystis sp. SCPEA4]MCY1054615.1 FHA domain-containing protein [Nannocystis sp. SCPEA4]